MRHREYKPGDRIFYKCFDGTIETDIVLEVKDSSYRDDNGKVVPFKWLVVDEHSGIEDYNCLSYNSPEVKELRKQYNSFDKAKPKLIAAISKILSPYSKDLQESLLKELEVIINNTK
jgi:hypothetical protein